MSASQVFGATIVDRDTEWPWKMADYGKLEGFIRNKRRSEAFELIGSCGITGNDKFVQLNTLLKNDVGLYDVRAFLNTYEGVQQVFRLSSKRAGRTEAASDELLDCYDFISAQDLAFRLVGFVLPETPSPNVTAGTESTIGATSTPDSAPATPASNPAT